MRLTRMIRRTGCFFALAVALVAATAFADNGFRPPLTAAEKALDRIIRRTQDDPALPRYLLAPSSPDPLRASQSRDMFTPALLAALENAEADLVYSRCGGRYIPGEQCGIRYNPVTCLDFEQDSYVYRTDSAAEYAAGAYNALIAYRLPEGQQIIATYSMLNVDGQWKLDGIECTVGGRFHM